MRDYSQVFSLLSFLASFSGTWMPVVTGDELCTLLLLRLHRSVTLGVLPFSDVSILLSTYLNAFTQGFEFRPYFVPYFAKFFYHVFLL